MKKLSMTILTAGLLSCVLQSAGCYVEAGDALPLVSFEDLPKATGEKPSMTFEASMTFAFSTYENQRIAENVKWAKHVEEVLIQSTMFADCMQAARGGDYHLKFEYYHLPLSVHGSAGAALTGATYGLIPVSIPEWHRLQVQVYQGEQIVGAYEYKNYQQVSAGLIYLGKAQSAEQMKKIHHNYRSNFIRNFLRDFAIKHLGATPPGEKLAQGN